MESFSDLYTETDEFTNIFLLRSTSSLKYCRT